MKNPPHGEEGHRCPAEEVIEWRPTAGQLLIYKQGIAALNQMVVNQHLIAQIVGDNDSVEAMTILNQELKESYEQIVAWEEEFAKTHFLEGVDVELMKRQEFDVPGSNSGPDARQGG